MKTNNVYLIGNNESKTFTVQTVEPTMYNGKECKTLPEEIVFCIEDVSKNDLQQGKDLVLSLSKASGYSLAMDLLKLLEKDIPVISKEY